MKRNVNILKLYSRFNPISRCPISRFSPISAISTFDLMQLVQLVHGRMQFLNTCRSLILNSESTGEL